MYTAPQGRNSAARDEDQVLGREIRQEREQLIVQRVFLADGDANDSADQAPVAHSGSGFSRTYAERFERVTSYLPCRGNLKTQDRDDCGSCVKPVWQPVCGR